MSLYYLKILKFEAASTLMITQVHSTENRVNTLQLSVF